MIRIGLIGCGFMGGMHAACYKALSDLGVQVTAIADVLTDRAEDLAKGSGAKVYASGMDLIENADVDAVDICLPTDLHVSHAVAAMKKGFDVFVEKPICIQEAEMEKIQKIQKETGRKVQVGQVIRLWTEYVWLKETKDSGVYGRFLSGAFKRVSARPTWASEGWLHDVSRSGGVACDMHVHDVDFVRYLLGEPDRVQAQAYRDEKGVVQQIFALYGYGKDVGVSVEAAWDYPQTFPFNGAFRVKFEKAVAVLDGGVLTVYPNEGEAFHPELPEEYKGDNDIGGNISSLGGYYNELKYFVEGLKGEHDLSVAPVDEAVKSIRLVLRELEIAGGLVAK
ncbi:MAG: Gfo/Idh/MocA family oxidoreductase [Oscillospiraceae bacterium]|nr:Gfo/Idh/MocA family oxidoreductase [Oscillospiraceae bacterium]